MQKFGGQNLTLLTRNPMASEKELTLISLNSVLQISAYCVVPTDMRSSMDVQHAGVKQ
jgi:hypothetical protein